LILGNIYRKTWLYRLYHPKSKVKISTPSCHIFRSPFHASIDLSSPLPCLTALSGLSITGRALLGCVVTSFQGFCTSQQSSAIFSGSPSSQVLHISTARAHNCCHPVGHGEVSPGKVLSFLAGKMPMRILSGKDGWMALGKFEPRIPDPSFSAWSAKGASQLTQTTRMR
jgi:hypothetical protein